MLACAFLPFHHSSPLLRPRPPDPQFVTDASGQPLELGKGAQAVVYQGRLQGYDVAVKVGTAVPLQLA